MALGMALCLAMGSTVFAAQPRAYGNYVGKKIEIASLDNTNQILTVATFGKPDTSDPVYTWTDQERGCQRWIIMEYGKDRYTVRPHDARDIQALNISGSRGNVAIVYPMSGATPSDQRIKIVDEGHGGSIWSKKHGIVLVDHLLAITKTAQPVSKFDSGSGCVAQWLPSNGLNNQLWYLNEVFN